MKSSDIEKAIEKFIDVPENDWDGIYNSGFSRGFRKGIDWFVSSIWEKDVDNEKRKGPILVKFTNGLYNLFESVSEIKDIKDKVDGFIYLEDLTIND